MKTSRMFILAAAMCMGAVAPALADWDRLATVSVDSTPDRDHVYSRFGGPIERLRIRADGSGVNCRGIRVTFDNGTTRGLFSGVIREGDSRDFDMPGAARRIDRIDFNCRSIRPRGATLIVFADVGRYRDIWRRSPDWARLWAGLFHWDSGGMGGGWTLLGTESFEGRRDTESTFAGFRGHMATRIALRPLDGPAQCNRVVVTFGDGGRTDVTGPGARNLRQGEYTTFDLPGRARNIDRLNLACHAIGDRQVRIQIYTDR